jgi:hypothetical protein
MTPGHVLRTVTDAGIRLYIQDGFLRYNAPVGAFHSALRARVRAVQCQLMTEWACQSCGLILPVLYGMDGNRRCRQCFEEGSRGTD